MSYRCENCNEAQASCDRPTKVVTEIRNRPSDFGYAGWEIVSEKNLCASCASETTDAGNVIRGTLRAHISKGLRAAEMQPAVAAGE